uniref:MABP domain-containing protein n=1 Tax=Periophthalmus magnuspinnatus TaxID=409849 RepID=A0A3B4BJP8_9GOBI
MPDVVLCSDSQLPAEPISAVGIVASPSKAPDGYSVVAQTTDGSDADLWKDGLFKSKVTRYLCFTRNPVIAVESNLSDVSSHAWLVPLAAATVYYCNLLWPKMKM